MKLATYPLTSSPAATTFRFTSSGPRGDVAKLVQLELVDWTAATPVYNLAFGDSGPSGALDDLVVSDNGDAERVLATVVAAVQLFLIAHPNALVYATGSTPARTRLYRMGLTRHLGAVEETVALFGILDGEPEYFEPGRPYEAFVVRRKSA